MTGTIPQELCREDLNADFFLSAPNNLPRDLCDSIACPVGEISVEGVYPCTPCQADYEDPYLGRVGECISLDQENILTKIYQSTNGEEWTGVGTKWSQDNSNYCEFTGVTCDNSKNVISLNLKGMNLVGTIPEEIGFLRYLETLDVSDNALTGFIPSDLRHPPLSTLDLSGNILIGIVPPMLCLKGINGNGQQGYFGCDRIACPRGTYSSTGIINERDSKCRPCKSANLTYLGSKECSGSNLSSQKDLASGVLSTILFSILMLLSLAVFVTERVRNHAKNLDGYRAPIDDEDGGKLT